MTRTLSRAVPATVFVVQRPSPRKHDGWVPNLEPALKFGKLICIFDADERAYAAPDSSRAKAALVLANFDSNRDFLVWPSFGDPACLWVVIMMLVIAGHHKLQFLYWSRGRDPLSGEMSNNNGYYMPVTLDFTK